MATEVPSACKFMAKTKHTSLFFFWYASSNNLVRTILKKIRLFSEKVPYLGKEATLVFVGTAYLLRDIVYSNQNKLVAEGIREWSHEVIPQTSKILTSRIEFRGIMSLLEIFPIF